MSIFKEFLQMSLTAVPIVLFVILIRFFLMRTPKIFSYALWAVVLFRLLCPVSFTSDFSFIGILEHSVAEGSAFENRVAAEEEVTPQVHHNELPGDFFANTTIPPTIGHDTEKPSVSFYDIAFYVWVSGVFSIACYSLVSYVRLKKALAISMPISSNIYIADRISTPFVMGIFKPRIYLPSNIPQSESGYIISHEQHHISRKDHIIKLIAFSALCLHWFNPAVWVAFSLAMRDMEMSCDEAVLKKLGKSERADYSQALLSLSTQKQRFSPSPIAFGEGNTKTRVKNIMKYRRPTVFIVLAAIILCIATILFLGSDPNKNELPTPFGYTYEVSEVTYHYNALSLLVTVETAPRITLTSDKSIMTSSHPDVIYPEDVTGIRGPVKNIELTEENFDNYFPHTSRKENGWANNSYSAEKLRKSNLNAWQFINDSEGNSYYILKQKNGDVYFAVWSYDAEAKNDPYSDDSFIHTLLKLEPVSQEKFPEFTYDFSDAENYIYTESVESVMKPTVSLSKKHKLFHFTYSMFSSYIPNGRYTERDGKLILDCGDGKIFVFRKTDDDELVFIQNESSPIPKYRYSGDSYITLSPVPDGAVFKKMNIINGIVDDPKYFESDGYLEKSVSHAILTNYRSDKPDGLIHTESHIILDTDELHGLHTTDGSDNVSKKNVYTISMHTSYSVSNGELSEVACDFSPAIIKFIINPNSSLTYDSIFIPGESGDYHFQKKTMNYFTEKSYKEALEYEKYRDEFSQSCYGSALAILNGSTTEYSEIEGLISAICSSPAWSSSPADYINEHQEEYKKLLKGENNTLGYCFSKFLTGGQTGLEGHIMAQACRVIIEKRGEKVKWDNYLTGQEWFDAFYKNAKELEKKHSAKELELLFPGSYIVLGTITP